MPETTPSASDPVDTNMAHDHHDSDSGDDDDDLQHLENVDFPIMIDDPNDETNTSHDNEMVIPNKSGDNGNNNNEKTQSEIIIDENAILRCFDLSIDAHIKGRGDVPHFEPLSEAEILASISSPINSVGKECADANDNSTVEDDAKNDQEFKEETTKPGGEGEQQQNQQQQQEQKVWSPGSLALPSWALQS